MKNYILIFFLSIFSFTLFSQSSFTTNSISVFKDGTVFMDKSATLDASSGKVILSDLPFTMDHQNPQTPIFFGTVLLTAPNNTIPSLKFFEETKNKNQDIQHMVPLLIANIDQKIKLSTLESNRTIEGVLKMVYNNTLVIKVANQWNQILVSDLKSFEFIGEKEITQTQVQEVKRNWELEFSKKNKNQKVQLNYLQKGIAWFPQYYLQILGNQKAKLNLKGNLMNDLEDLNDVEVNFVVGVPAFKFGKIHDPIASHLNFQVLLNQIRSGKNSREKEYAIVYSPETYEEQVIAVDKAPDFEGLNNEDLFFYKKEKISLEKGDRVLLDFFETEIDYEDIYTVVIKKNVEKRNQYGNNSNEGGRNIVWHSLIFENKTDYPLTEGSIFFLKKEGDTNLPISQNEIEHTPPKAMVDVKMAIAKDIIVLDADKEIEREKNARNRNEDLVTIEGTIDVTNYQDKEVSLKIERSVKGMLLRSDLDWNLVSLTNQLNSRNPHNKAIWEFELKAGETKKITYTYQVYVY